MISIQVVKEGETKPVVDKKVKEDDFSGLNRMCEALKLDRDVFDSAVSRAIFTNETIVMELAGVKIRIVRSE